MNFDYYVSLLQKPDEFDPDLVLLDALADPDIDMDTYDKLGEIKIKELYLPPEMN